LDLERSRGQFWQTLAPFGPAFVASVAYVDPGNFATNFPGGAEFGYQLLWVVVLASTVAVLVQYLASKLDLMTGARSARGPGRGRAVGAD
jgi:manganese transport protein